MKNLLVNGSAIQRGSCAIRFTTRRRIQLAAIVLLFLFTSSAVVLAQNQQRATEGQTGVSIVAAITDTGARFTAPKEIGEMGLAVFSPSGEKIFDSDFQRGNILDWSLKKGGQSPPPDGDYLFLLSLRDLTGRLSRQQTVASLGGGKVISLIADPTRITAAQSSVLASNSLSLENLEWLTLRREGTSAALTTHDGSDSQITSTKGALTFRTGELFAGKDQEQMRITPDGRVGIGTANPQATLDVAGDVRARGIRFEDGTMLSSATGPTKTGPDGTDQPLVDGTGTTNRVTKWTNGPAGTLGDSALTETGGKLA